MDWNLVLGPAVVAVLVSGLVFFVSARQRTKVDLKIAESRREVDREIANNRVEVDQELAALKVQYERDLAQQKEQHERDLALKIAESRREVDREIANNRVEVDQVSMAETKCAGSRRDSVPVGLREKGFEALVWC